MTGLAELLEECDSHGIRLSLVGDRELTIDAPKAALTPDLVGRLKAHKSELLSILTADPVALSTRQQVYGQMIERVNAASQGCPIDWPKLDTIESQIFAAQTVEEFLHKISEYEIAATTQKHDKLLDNKTSMV